MLLCALVNDDLIQENIISYCFLRCYIYVSLLLTRLHMRLNCGMCLLQTSRGTDDVKRRLRPRVATCEPRPPLAREGSTSHKDIPRLQLFL